VADSALNRLLPFAVAALTLAMGGRVLFLELRYGTARAWVDGVQFVEALAVFTRTAAVLHMLPILGVVIAALVRPANCESAPRDRITLRVVCSATFALSCCLFGALLIWWY